MLEGGPGDISVEWQAVINRYHLDDFDVVWDMQLDIIDEPNRARGGWSTVGRYMLEKPVAGARSIYIKRQENYAYRSLTTPWVRRPLCEREYQNLRWCHENNIPVVSPLIYKQDRSSGNIRAILVTIGLDNYVPLSVVEKEYDLAGPVRRKLIDRVARLVRRMHQQGFLHTCLYSKHIYVEKSFLQDGDGDIRLIDLEKGRPLNRTLSGTFRDLDSLNRHATGWSTRDRVRFLKHYLRRDKGELRNLFDRLSCSYTAWIGKK